MASPDAPTEQGGPKPPELASLRKMFEESQSLTVDGRKQSQIDDDYFHGFQWTPTERATLKGREQPDNVFNRTKPAVLGTLGVIKQGSTDPRAYPRNPQDEEAADVASKTLRFIADKAAFDDTKIDVAYDYLTPGTGAAIIEYQDGEITVTQIRWEEFFYDPRSRRQNFSDARYMGIAKWQYADDLEEAYPDAKDEIRRTVENGGTGAGGFAVDQTFEDRPTDASATVSWVDGRKRRLMTVEMYHREAGTWRRCVFTAGAVLAYDESPYLDDKQRPCNPIEAQSCFVDRENSRYGIVRDMRGPQDEINKRRSKLLHLLSVRQIQEREFGSGGGIDVDAVSKEAAKPNGVIPPGWMIVPTADLAQGQAQLLAEAKAEIERMGPNPAILGRQGESQSGRSNLIRQQAGLTEQAVIFGGIEEWELRVYRQMWNRARQFKTAPWWVRVTDDEGAAKFVGVNQFQHAADPMTGQAMAGEDGQPIRVPMTDPNTGQPQPMNVLAELDVDIILDTTPDTANVQQEQFAMMVELAKIGALGPNAGPMLLKASSLPNKTQVLEEMKGQSEQQAQQAQEAQQIQKAGAIAQVQKDTASADQSASTAELNRAKAAKEQLESMMTAQAAQAGLFAPPPLPSGPMPSNQPPPGF